MPTTTPLATWTCSAHWGRASTCCPGWTTAPARCIRRQPPRRCLRGAPSWSTRRRRWPATSRRPVGGFVELEAASRAGRVGYVLSSSVSGESHEWSGFESGVFSHEVRSGLYGAADADGDGRITYSEIAAFVARANQGIENNRF